MTDIQIQNQTSNLTASKKEFENRYDDKALRILCVKNISKETKENELMDLFKQFGSIESINLKVNKNVGPYAIYAHVLFSAPDEAKRCLKQMNGKILKGRALRIDFKRYNNKIDDDGDNISGNIGGSASGAINGNVSNSLGPNPNNSNSNNSKYSRKMNKNNQFYNNRYINNNKRTVRNEGTPIDEHNNTYDSEANNFRDFEMSKRTRTGNPNDSTNFHNISNLNSDVDINKLLKNYGDENILNNMNGEDKNSEVEKIIQNLINDMTKKPPRIKLLLCDHLKQCAQHVFNRPVVSINISNNHTNTAGIPYNFSTSSTFSTSNTVGVIPSVPLSQQEQQNIMITNLSNYLNFNDPNKYSMNIDGTNTKDMITAHSSSNILYNSSNTNNNFSSNGKKVIWKGTLEMRNKENMKIYAYALNGNVNAFLKNSITNIIISHRKKMKNIPKVEATYYFEMENEKDANIFESYKNYFNNKDRVGLASTDENWHLYIIFPGSPVFNEFFSSSNNIIGMDQSILGNIFIGVVCYNPQVVDKKGTSSLTLQNGDGSMNNGANPNSASSVSFAGNMSTVGGVSAISSTRGISSMTNPSVNIKHSFVIHQGGGDHSGNNSGNSIAKGGMGNNHLTGTNSSIFQKQVLNLNGINHGRNNNTLSGNLNSNYDNKGDVAPVINRQNIPSTSVQSGIVQSQQTNASNEREENKNEIPNWLNQFSSLAAYLVKK
ncbi:hypothetical protein, conserved [Plasmodium ovale curtisi]|uniref:RRM domain-containing protein n=1 Tax=Plasmodium ovale curtisi TaxID=864141 RepID=A0A1A8WXQ4_PLAOA|nr:hypothetical protein, conserved [Plasmodium ovale curtisi]